MTSQQIRPHHHLPLAWPPLPRQPPGSCLASAPTTSASANSGRALPARISLGTPRRLSLPCCYACCYSSGCQPAKQVLLPGSSLDRNRNRKKAGPVCGGGHLRDVPTLGHYVVPRMKHCRMSSTLFKRESFPNHFLQNCGPCKKKKLRKKVTRKMSTVSACACTCVLACLMYTYARVCASVARHGHWGVEKACSRFQCKHKPGPSARLDGLQEQHQHTHTKHIHTHST